MRRALLAIAMLSSLASLSRAQDDRYGKISCHRNGSEDPQNRAYTKKLWDGYEISLGPARNGTIDGNGCTAAIYDGGGHVVFRTTGFSVIFDENHTGLDVDGDGKPEVVFLIDTGGGNHCCWGYNVVSLFPKPHRLFDLPYPARFEKDKSGKLLIWEDFPGPYGFTTNAYTPGAQKVFRVSQGRLEDHTPEFCPEILSPRNMARDEEVRIAALEKIDRLPSGSEPEDETASTLLSLALQHTFCRQFDKALHYLNLWPEVTGNPVTSRKRVLAAFAESIKEDYPDFAARLMPSGGTASAQINNAPPKITKFLNLGNQETFLAAKLTAAERKQIIDQVEKTSFDVPDDWESELRVRRVPLGRTDGFVIRGTRLLCGATGNCETWVFRRDQGNWVNLFEEEGPIVSEFGFDQETTNGIKNFLVSAHFSGTKENQILFKFDGRFYRPSECYDVSVNATVAEKVIKVRCK